MAHSRLTRSPFQGGIPALNILQIPFMRFLSTFCVQKCEFRFIFGK
jgi:hypothetical protein